MPAIASHSQTTRPDLRNDRTPSGDPGIVELEFAEAIRPSWVEPEMRLRVPVPDVPGKTLDEDRTLLWGLTDKGYRFPLAAMGNDGMTLAYPWESWRAYVRTESYATWRRRPFFTRLPISYCAIPASIRHRIATGLYRRRPRHADLFPQPTFDGGFEALRHLVAQHDRHLEPDPPPARVCLTHDIDTAEGFAWVKPIAEVEMSLGLRSSWNVVTGQYTVDHHTLGWLVERGFEIGLHDDLHDNKLIYLDEPGMRRRLDRCRTFIDRYNVRGFRSPSWLRNEQLMSVLSDYVSYDCSCLDFDWLCPAGRGGVLTATPFRRQQLVEIPTTLPFEAPLLTGLDDGDPGAYWRPKVEWLVKVGGQAVVNTHPDPHYGGNAEMVRAYGRFLEELLDAYRGKWSLPYVLAEEV